MTCGNNTLVINRPTLGQSSSMQCQSSCGLGTAGSNCPKGIGPRKKREAVIQQIREYILFMLGAPVVQIELDEQQVEFAANQALKIIEDYAPREYFSYYTFVTTPGKSIYELPPDVGYVRSIEYKNIGQFSFQASDLGGSIPLEYFYSGGAYENGGMINPITPVWGRAGEWQLYKQYEQMFSKMSSNIGGWEYIGGYRHIKLYPVPCGGSKVAVNYLQKCKDWEEVTQAMQEGALTYAKEMLGRIRGRIKNPPGPNGGVQLDGDQLMQEAREDRTKWMEDLIYKFGDIPPFFMG